MNHLKKTREISFMGNPQWTFPVLYPATYSFNHKIQNLIFTQHYINLK